ncbi:MAG: DNA adenine methylase [Clostridium cadaveris]|uniref:DNA adenine methylase n=1 Tax=Clostridium cadaveris TaxID=1529 RepID=A0A316M5N5_9CLOT|nr:MAG: DNA adenine methylase [Clostridium cadaveris]
MLLKTENLNVDGNRKEIREAVIKKFLNEEPGTGSGENCSRYRYDVEETSDGSKVYLRRPAPLNKGVDFEVHVENVRFREKGRVHMPSHSNIIQDLIDKKDHNSDEYQKVMNIINKLYNCEIVKEAEYRNIKFDIGHSIEAILKSIKWLFIEQDVTYWNWSGRAMLYSKLREENLC